MYVVNDANPRTAKSVVMQVAPSVAKLSDRSIMDDGSTVGDPRVCGV